MNRPILMQRISLMMVLALCWSASTSQAQATAKMRSPAAKSVAAIHAHLLEHLYSGIVLSKEQEARVHAIIDHSLAANDSVSNDPRRQELWDRNIAQRNAALRAVLTTEVDRLKFDANLKRVD